MSGEKWRDVEKAWNSWLIAEEVVLETNHFRGRFFVEDIKEDETTTTYTMSSADRVPLGFGILKPYEGES